MHGPAIMIFSIGKSIKRTRPYSGNGGGMQIFEKTGRPNRGVINPAMMIGRRSLAYKQLTHSTSTIISTSTALLKGSPAIPTAERACLPFASPKTSTIKSENPLMTRG